VIIYAIAIRVCYSYLICFVIAGSGHISSHASGGSGGLYQGPTSYQTGAGGYRY